MVRPLFQHAHGHGSRLSDNVRDSLSWWHDVLDRRVVELRKFKASVQAPVVMWADARGSPPRLAAVALINDQWFFCDMEPSVKTLRRARGAPVRRAPSRSARPPRRRQFSQRADSQITGLEILAVALGLCTWESSLQGRDLIVFSDNTAAEAILKKGCASACDHRALAHVFWSVIGALDMRVLIERVPTEVNIADLPSREEYDLLARLGARRTVAGLSRVFVSPARQRGSR